MKNTNILSRIVLFIVLAFNQSQYGIDPVASWAGSLILQMGGYECFYKLLLKPSNQKVNWLAKSQKKLPYEYIVEKVIDYALHFSRGKDNCFGSQLFVKKLLLQEEVSPENFLKINVSEFVANTTFNMAWQQVMQNIGRVYVRKTFSENFLKSQHVKWLVAPAIKSFVRMYGKRLVYDIYKDSAKSLNPVLALWASYETAHHIIPNITGTNIEQLLRTHVARAARIMGPLTYAYRELCRKGSIDNASKHLLNTLIMGCLGAGVSMFAQYKFPSECKNYYQQLRGKPFDNKSGLSFVAGVAWAALIDHVPYILMANVLDTFSRSE